MDKALAWKLSVKDTFNKQARQTLPPYHEQVSRELWSHVHLAARNALMDYLLTPAGDLSSTCTREHWERLGEITAKLAKITLHTSPHAIVYRCNLFTPEDEDGRSYNTDDWNQAATLEFIAEEPYATFLRRDTAADLRNILAAAGLNPAQAKPYEDSNGKAVIVAL